MRKFEHKTEKHGKFRIAIFNNAEEINESVQDDGTDLYASLDERIKNNDSWSFGEYGGKSVELINEGRCDVKPSDERIIKRVHGGKAYKRRKVYSDFDGEISTEQVISGSMTPFVKKKRIKTSGKTIDVVVSLSIHCGYSSDRIAEYAKAVSERVFTLVSQGRNVNVYYCSGATDVYKNGDGCFSFIKLKSGRNKLDVQRIITMAYPGMFRYYIFKSQHAGGKDVEYGRGYPIANKSKEEADKLLTELIETININKKIIYDMGDWDKSGGKLKSITKYDVETL
jgi:hypothetical protein